MNNAVVVGYGVVGKATAKTFGIKAYSDLQGSNVEWAELIGKKYVFLCLPTPTENGVCNTWAIEEWIRDLAVHHPTFIIRSTVTPGFANAMMEKYNALIVSNPEFLSEDTVDKDVKFPKMVVIGADDPKARKDIKALYSARYSYIQPILTNNVTAELIKYTFNTWFSTKIMFFNGIYDVAQRVGANYETIRTAIEAHPWGAKNHTAVWYKERRGIHGRCLPKDLEAFAKFSELALLQVIEEENRRRFNVPKQIGAPEALQKAEVPV